MPIPKQDFILVLDEEGDVIGKDTSIKETVCEAVVSIGSTEYAFDFKSGGFSTETVSKNTKSDYISLLNEFENANLKTSFEAIKFNNC